MALIVQKTGQRQGNANTRFYPLGNAQYGASGVAVFHDTISGNNSVPGVTGYSAGTGYDLATGLGSVDANALVNNWAPDFTISASPAGLSVPQGSVGTSTISTATLGNFSNAVSLSASGLPAGVTASSNPTTIAAPGAGNSTMTFTVGASAPAGTSPVTVTGAGGGMTHTTPINLTVLQVFTITSAVSNGVGGAIAPGSATVPSGGSATLTVSPSVGYHLVSLTDNGINVTASVNNGSYTISNVTADQTVLATFAINTYTITGVSTGNGSIAPSNGSVNYGASVTFTITPASGYTLGALTDNGVGVTATEGPPGTFTYTITNVTADHAVQATFSQLTAVAVPAMGLWVFLVTAAALGIIGIRKKKPQRKPSCF